MLLAEQQNVLKKQPAAAATAKHSTSSFYLSSLLSAITVAESGKHLYTTVVLIT